VIRVVVDPVARAVTHVVVEPKHRTGVGRLVPVDLLDIGHDEVGVRCTRAEFDNLERAEEREFLPGMGGYDSYGPGEALYRPYYGLVGNQYGPPGMNPVFGLGSTARPLVRESIPAGEAAIRRGEPVQARDGAIGRVHGLVIDPSNHHVTHVLLQEGHLWGSKQVAIPISAVTRVDDSIVLNINKHQVQGLPAVDLDPPVSPDGP
jgi:sporulation protein YlmC with PRC-barrel domain